VALYLISVIQNISCLLIITYIMMVGLMRHLYGDFSHQNLNKFIVAIPVRNP